MVKPRKTKGSTSAKLILVVDMMAQYITFNKAIKTVKIKNDSSLTQHTSDKMVPNYKARKYKLNLLQGVMLHENYMHIKDRTDRQRMTTTKRRC